MKVSIAYKDDKYFNPVDFGYFSLGCDFTYKSRECAIEFYSASNEFLGTMSATPFTEVIIIGDDICFYCRDREQANSLFSDIELNTHEQLTPIVPEE